MKQIEPHDHHLFYEREEQRDRAEELGDEMESGLPRECHGRISPKPHSNPLEGETKTFPGDQMDY